MNIDDARKLVDSLNRFAIPEFRGGNAVERSRALCQDLNVQFPALFFSPVSGTNPKIKADYHGR